MIYVCISVADLHYVFTPRFFTFSVLLQTPEHLLQDIILVDDKSKNRKYSIEKILREINRTCFRFNANLLLSYTIFFIFSS